MSTNVYEDILANIDSEKRAWCKGAWDVREDGEMTAGGVVIDDGYRGKPVSRCLVSHIDLALGVSYVKDNGKRFVSKDVKKWRRRERVLAHLFSLLPKQTVENILDENGMDTPLEQEITRGRVRYVVTRIPTDLSEAMVAFNDSDTTTKAKVRTLLKKAAQRHPED